MKYVILLLPTLLAIALVGIPPRTYTAPPLTREQRDAEIRELRAELKSANVRLNVLQAQGRQFLPRGMGR